MFIAALFTIAKACKQPKCPSKDDWIRKKWYIYTSEYYSAIIKMYLFLIIKIFYKYKKTRIWKEKNFIIRSKNSEGTLDDFWEKKKKKWYQILRSMMRIRSGTSSLHWLPITCRMNSNPCKDHRDPLGAFFIYNLCSQQAPFHLTHHSSLTPCRYSDTFAFAFVV